MPFEREFFLPVCTAFIFVCTSGDTVLFKFCNRHIGKLANFQDIEMGPTAFKRESFVSICTSFISGTNDSLSSAVDVSL